MSLPVEGRLSAHGSEETRAALGRLEADGFIVPRGQTWKTTRAWQQAMARAAVRLYAEGDAGDDLRVPIAVALMDVYADTVEDETLVGLVEAMLPIETASLGFAATANDATVAAQ